MTLGRKPFKSIRSQVLLYTATIILIFGVVLGGVGFYAVFVNSDYTLIRESETSLLYVASSIDNNIDSIRSFVLSSQISKNITNYAMEANPYNNVRKKEAHDFLQNTYAANPSLRDNLVRIIVIGDNRPDLIQSVEPVYSSPLINKSALLRQPFFEKAVSDAENPTCGIIKDPFLKSQDVDMIPFVFNIYHPYRSDSIGYIFAEMSTKALTIPIDNALPTTDERFYIKTPDKLYLYEDHRLIESDESIYLTTPFNNDNFTIIRFRDDNNKRVVALSYPLGITDWYVIKCTDTSLTTNRIISMFSVVFLCLIIFLLLVGTLLYHLLSKMFNVPVTMLTQRIQRIEQGDFSRDPQTEWNNELGDIGRTINDLSENVYSLMNQRIEDERQKKDYEYQILQSQVNPHFLYNTLNSIKWMATIQNAPGIAEMTTSLSRLLKDISKGTNRIISLEHELSLANDYFTIQKYRYGGIIALDVNVMDKELYNCEIPRFTLQPLIENAIFHGIEPKGTSGTITINVHRDLDDVYIEVCDDGVGMDSDKVDNFLTDNPTPNTAFFKEVGIGNVHKRLQYEYGSKYGLSIKSELGQYTNVIICIPFNVISTEDTL